MLNGRELIERKIITGLVVAENIQQHGIDLNLIDVKKVNGHGLVSINKTILGNYEQVEEDDLGRWCLSPGVYDVVFRQGCNIPRDVMLLIRQRSSLLRNGTTLHSSVFDAGFKTDNIGTVMVVHVPIVIEHGARIAQIYNHACSPVENLYDGQFQNDKQRK